jgi:hypothetical protein
MSEAIKDIEERLRALLSKADDLLIKSSFGEEPVSQASEDAPPVLPDADIPPPIEIIIPPTTAPKIEKAPLLLQRPAITPLIEEPPVPLAPEDHPPVPPVVNVLPTAETIILPPPAPEIAKSPMLLQPPEIIPLVEGPQPQVPEYPPPTPPVVSAPPTVETIISPPPAPEPEKTPLVDIAAEPPSAPPIEPAPMRRIPHVAKCPEIGTEIPFLISYPESLFEEAQELFENLESLRPKFTKTEFYLRGRGAIPYSKEHSLQETAFNQIRELRYGVFLLITRRRLSTKESQLLTAEIAKCGFYFQEVLLDSISKKAFYFDFLLGLAFFLKSVKALPENTAQRHGTDHATVEWNG